MNRYGRVYLHHPINPNHLEEAVVRAQEGKELVPNDQGFDLGMENPPPTADIFALTLDIRQSTKCMTELMSHITELNSEIANVTSVQDQFQAAIERFNNNIMAGEGLDLTD